MKLVCSIRAGGMFERRELTRNVHIDAKLLQRNIQSSLVAQLRLKYEGVCVAEGYIQRQSISVVDYSLGRTNLIKGGIDYAVKFQADICMPHPGQIFRMPVTLKSKIGIHAEEIPVKALLPRDLHIGNEEFDSVLEKQEVEFEVVGARFQQGDDTIVVLGKLRNVIEPAREAPREGEGVGVNDGPPIIAAPTGTPDEAPIKKVTVDAASTKPMGDAAPRKRRVRLNVDAKAKTDEA